MTTDEWAGFLEERIANWERICEQIGHEPRDHDLTATFTGTSARGIGVRPQRLGSEFREGKPVNIYGLTYAQCKKALAKAQAARNSR